MKVQTSMKVGVRTGSRSVSGIKVMAKVRFRFRLRVCSWLIPVNGAVNRQGACYNRSALWVRA